jgi:DNA replication protein DnaC
MEAQRNLVILGPVGVGKTFVASALGQLACRSGFNVRFSRADELLRLLRQSRLDNCREALMLGLSVVDLLIIDDFALEPMTRDESRDFYQLLVERTALAATIITSNRDTADCSRSSTIHYSDRVQSIAYLAPPLFGAWFRHWAWASKR